METKEISAARAAVAAAYRRLQHAHRTNRPDALLENAAQDLETAEQQLERLLRG